MEIAKILDAVCTASGPSGFEGGAAKVCAQLLEQYAENVRTDALGNVAGDISCGKQGAPRLLLDAHIDEIGFMVTGYEEGFLRFRSLGGVDPRMLLAREVTVLTDPPMFGLIACLPPPTCRPPQTVKSL